MCQTSHWNSHHYTYSCFAMHPINQEMQAMQSIMDAICHKNNYAYSVLMATDPVLNPWSFRTGSMNTIFFPSSAQQTWLRFHFWSNTIFGENHVKISRFLDCWVEGGGKRKRAFSTQEKRLNGNNKVIHYSRCFYNGYNFALYSRLSFIHDPDRPNVKNDASQFCTCVQQKEIWSTQNFEIVPRFHDGQIKEHQKNPAKNIALHFECTFLDRLLPPRRKRRLVSFKK